MVKNLLAMQETQVRSFESGRSPGEGNGYPLQHSCRLFMFLSFFTFSRCCCLLFYSKNRISRDDSSRRPVLYSPFTSWAPLCVTVPIFSYTAAILGSCFLDQTNLSATSGPLYASWSILPSFFFVWLLLTDLPELWSDITSPEKQERDPTFIHFVAPCRRKGRMGMSTLPAFNSSNPEWNCSW